MNPITQAINIGATRFFFGFAVKCFQTLNPGTAFEPNWHIEAICHALEQCRNGPHKRLIINLPPRHLKSLLVSIAYPAWLLGHDPRVRIIVVSYSQELSNDLSRQFRSFVTSSWYRAAFPGCVAAKDVETEFVTSQNGYRLSTSTGGTITGRGADYIIMDDIIKPDDAYSAASREVVDNWRRSTLMSRFDKPASGRMILVMQRLHEDDPTGRILKTSRDWQLLKLASIAEEDETIPTGDKTFHRRKKGEVLHERRLSRDYLDRTKDEIGSLNFTAQYQQRPLPEEGNLVKREWFPCYDEPLERPAGSKTILSLDTAMKAGSTNDYSVAIVVQQRGRDLCIKHIMRAHLDYPELKRRIEAMYLDFQVDTMLIEDSAAGTPLIQELMRRHTVIPIRPQGDKVSRLRFQSDLIESRAVLLPKNAPWLDDFLAEVTGFPNAAHDDQVDALTQLLSWVRQHGQPTFSCDWGSNDGATIPYPEDLLWRLRQGRY